MTGPISFEFAATMVAIVVGAIVVYRLFQTKAEAEESEKRMAQALESEKKHIESKLSAMSDTFTTKITSLESKVQDVHKHLEAVRGDFKEDLKLVHSDLRSSRERSEAMYRDVSWIRGRLEVGSRDVGAG